MIEDLFKDKEYCFGQIREAREIFGNTNTTEKQYEAMEKTLGLGYLCCPSDIAHLFHATLLEATMRKFYYQTKIWA